MTESLKMFKLKILSMIEGPKLAEGQFAVMMCDGATGHVLTTEGKVYLSDSTPVYFVFNDINVARNFIQLSKQENDLIEFSVFDCNYINFEYWSAPGLG